MKVSSATADRFVETLGPGILAVLLYGPDGGLIRERANKASLAVVEELSDPFRVAEIPAAALRDDPARLADEAAALSLTGGRRVVRLRDAADGATDALTSMLQGETCSALVVVEAGELGPRSRLRKLFEDDAGCAAIACYADDPGALESVIRETLSASGLGVTEDALNFLIDNLGGDRMVSRMELEKLATYAAGADRVSLEDASACVGDSARIALDDIAFAAASGNQPRLVRALRRALDEGADPIGVLRVASRHFLRLHLAAGLIAGGDSADRAMKTLRPPVFFQRGAEFRAQLGRWNAPSLATAIAALGDAEIDCKSTGMPAEAICERTLMRLAARRSAGSA